jgi:Zn ribbon nucleic-acid-binding protein
MHVISNCPLCGERALHVIGEKDVKSQQCINCGYVTAEKFKYAENVDVEHFKPYQELTDDMKKWTKHNNGQIWIPTIMTLPFAILYPFDDKDGKMKWGLAEMVDIPEEERKNFPVEGQKDKFYERKYDTENTRIFDKFVLALSELNKWVKFNSGEGV